MRRFLKRLWTRPPMGRTIDLVAEDPEGNVILGLIDLTTWASTEKVLALQERINLCMEYCHGKQFLEEHPRSRVKQVTIRIYLGEQPEEEGTWFLAAVAKSVKSFGVDFDYQRYES